MPSNSYSVVGYYAEQEKYQCGYCKNPDTNYSHGMWAHSLTVDDYQNLIDRGWRRSGSYCYKPIMDQICCPAYTIKCEALNFKISKSQKKVLKRMAKFLRNELQKEEVESIGVDDPDNLDLSNKEIPNYAKHYERAQKNASEMNVTSIHCKLKERLSQAGDKEQQIAEASTHSEIKMEVSSKEKETVSEGKRANSTQSLGIDPNKTPPKKAKLLRKERKERKLLAEGKTQEEIDAIFKGKGEQNTTAKSLEDLFEEVYNGNQKLEMRLVRPSSKNMEYAKSAKRSFELYKKYQTAVHRVPLEQVTEQQYTRFLVRSPLQMRLLRVMSNEFLETLDESAKLYEKYQTVIHGDPPEECAKKLFVNFLVKSPLEPSFPPDGPPQGYGSFHEQYWLNNELIAVAVLDILPFCISSVYFFYDPSYSHLSLGTFSSLREVYLTRQMNKVTSKLKYYYMGFYIHSCPKMRYKGRMTPSKLLCPETYTWHDIEKCLPKLDREKYSRLNDDINAIDVDSVIDIQRVLVLYRGTAMPYRIYKQRTSESSHEEDEEVTEYAGLVGMKCAQSLLLYRG